MFKLSKFQEENTSHLISKKTKTKSICSICNQKKNSYIFKNLIVSCSICTKKVHIRCYGLNPNIELNFSDS